METAIESKEPILVVAVKGASKAALLGPISDRGVGFYGWEAAWALT